MSTGFAGAASHDDRRRRRLLTDPNGEPVGGGVYPHGVPETRRNHRFPLKRVVHYHAWRLWLLAGVLLLAGAGIVYGSWIAETRDLGPGFARLFAAADGMLYGVVTGLGFFLCGQLAGLIGWARGRSLTDFAGRYRIWRWNAAVFFTLALGTLLHADRALSDTLDWMHIGRPWSHATLDWWIPAVTLSLVLVWLTDREVRSSKLARAHLWLGFATLSAGAAVLLVPALANQWLVARGLQLSGLLLLAMGLVWFTRHVLYFSAEPTPLVQRNWLAWLGRIRLPRLFRRSAAAEGDESDDSETDAESESSGSTKPRRKRAKTAKRKTSSRRSTRRAAAAEEDTSDEEPAEDVPEPEAPVAPPRVEPPRSRIRIDAPHASPVPPSAAFVSADDRESNGSDEDSELLDDPELVERAELMQMMISEGESVDDDLFKGLSKRQKRLLKRKQRQLERQLA